MDEFTADAFVNRDDPIPIITFDRTEDFSDEEGQIEVEGKDGRRQGLRKHLSKSNIKDKIRKATGKTSESGTSMQDRLLEKYASSKYLITIYTDDLDCCSRSFRSKI